MSNIATKVRDLSGWKGDAALYRLDPPAESGEFVVASAIDIPNLGFDYRRTEAMVFPANEKGEVTDWGEIGFAAERSQSAALKDMGYEVTS